MEQRVLQESEDIKRITDDVVISDKENFNTNMESGTLLGLIPVFVLLLVIFVRIAFVIYKSTGQKTRNTQQRRTFIGTRQRPSDTQAEPTIYVSPANLPPPPKYEAMAPPSYEEVVGIHYPNYQPISHPISTALAQTSTDVSNVNVVASNNANDVNNANNATNNANNATNNANIATNNGEDVVTSNTQTPPTVLSVISERPVTVSS